MPLFRVLLCLVAFALPFASVHADARLDTRLGLSVDQARQVNEVEARYRKTFASQRQAFNRESRALRRARIANDSAEISRLEGVMQGMEDGLIKTRAEWDDAIRALLTPDQIPEFEKHVQERKNMVGRRTDPTY